MARRYQPALTPADRRRHTFLAVGLGCAAGFALAAVVAGIIYSQLMGQPALPPDVQQRYAADTAQPSSTPTPAPPATTPSGTTALPLKQQVASVAEAVRTGQRGPVTLYVSDAELNQEISRMLQGRDEVKSAKAYFADEKVYIILTVDWRGRDVNLTIIAAPIIVNGGLQFGVESAKIGSMNAPAAIRQKIQQGLNRQQSQWSPQKTGVEFESVTVTRGQATLKGHTVGR
ncbi:MAG: hypothetical protein HPY69_03665 [Armatimonadetes bacterium]|nr:hypothetical protein [Armatimonadota bacterium]